VAAVTIKVRENGPYRVTGPFTLIDADGVAYELPAGETVALCRCGRSSTKPFCDATHKRVEFQARERVRTSPLREARPQE
jgi:CDGSH-type Zn-finger protein